MAQSPAHMVREFHHVFGLRIADQVGFNLDLPLRTALLHEEYHESLVAGQQQDIVEYADALADMVYVIYGTALSFGIDLDAVLTEVHRSNMSKLGDDGMPLYKPNGKVAKGPLFSKPDIAQVLGI